MTDSKPAPGKLRILEGLEPLRRHCLCIRSGAMFIPLPSCEVLQGHIQGCMGGLGAKRVRG